MKTLHTLLIVLLLSFCLQAQEQNPLSASGFDKLLNEVAEQSYDSKRLGKAKEISDAHFLYANQINDIIAALNLESNRLDYAKYAYSTVFDAENYDVVYSNFTMSKSKSDLKEYLSKREAPVISDNEVTNVIKEDVISSSTTTNTTTITTTKTIVNPSGPAAMNDQEFAAAKRAVSEESFESKKLKRSKQVSDANYLLCSQVVELMQVLSFESSRLEYAKYAYAKTFDQINYEIVKEGLSHSKSREELAAFVKKQPVKDYSVKEEMTVANDAVDNNTAAGMSQEDFTQTKILISSQSSDVKKLEKAKQITGRTYLSTKQVKIIVQLFLFEDNRLEYAQFAYARTSDKAHYELIKEALEKDSHKILDDYIKNAPKDEKVEAATEKSDLSTEDFAALLKRIKGSALESHKLDKAKTIVDRAHVNTAQIKQIIDLFTLEDTRLEFAKYAYPRTLDKNNFKLVRDALYKSTSRYNLDRFIKSQK